MITKNKDLVRGFRAPRDEDNTRRTEPNFFFFFFFFGLFRLHPQHMEIPRLGVESELQLLTYTTSEPRL